MIKSDIRKSLTTVNISQYDSVIETFSKRLEARNLAESTAFSYIGCLKIFFAFSISRQRQPWPLTMRTSEPSSLSWSRTA